MSRSTAAPKAAAASPASATTILSWPTAISPMTAGLPTTSSCPTAQPLPAISSSKIMPSSAALSGIHQFVRIGAYAMVGGVSGVPQDVPPYVIAAGERTKLSGINIVGLKRHGFSPEVISELKAAYRIFFRSGLTVKRAVQTIEEEGLAVGRGAVPEQFYSEFRAGGAAEMKAGSCCCCRCRVSGEISC